MNQDNLTQAFFDELAEAAGKGTLADGGGAAASSTKQYSKYLSLGGKLVGFAKLVPIPCVAPLALDYLQKALDNAGDFGEMTSAAIDGKARPLSILKREAEKVLRELPHSILVVLDDLDRPTQPELPLILQLVKANADFPTHWPRERRAGRQVGNVSKPAKSEAIIRRRMIRQVVASLDSLDPCGNG